MRKRIGKLQRQCRRAFWAANVSELPTSALVAWCYVRSPRPLATWLNSQRSLTDAAHALHRCTAHSLCHGSGLVLRQNGVEPIKFVSAACEARDTRRHSDERSRWRLQRLRTSFHSGKDLLRSSASPMPTRS
jgi:hypothetical protein